MPTPKKTLKTLEDRVGLWAILGLGLLALTGELFTKNNPGWGIMTGLLTFGALTTALRFERRVQYVKYRHAAGLLPGSRPITRTQVRRRKPAPNPQNLGICVRHQQSSRYNAIARDDSSSDHTPH